MHGPRSRFSTAETTEQVVAQRPWSALLFWIAVMAALGLTGALVTLPKVANWYADLAKPAFTPPNEVFGPVWTVLYLMMALAIWRIGGIADWAAGWRATAWFNAQLALNAAWSPVFFGLEAPKLALAVIVALGIAVAATIVVFWRLDRLAALLLVPYLLWVGYATALNGAIAVLN
jgi:tryptophan-rich sensory protein